MEAAEDGEKGIEFFREKGRFDLVFTDTRMPRMDGNEVARYIRSSETAETPIAAITAHEDEVQKEMFDFSMLKSFSNKELIRILGSIEQK